MLNKKWIVPIVQVQDLRLQIKGTLKKRSDGEESVSNVKKDLQPTRKL